MRFVRFTQSMKCGGEHFSDDVYINVDRILFIKKFQDPCSSIEYPSSATIDFGRDDLTRVDGTIEEVMEKIRGAE